MATSRLTNSPAKRASYGAAAQAHHAVMAARSAAAVAIGGAKDLAEVKDKVDQLDKKVSKALPPTK